MPSEPTNRGVRRLPLVVLLFLVLVVAVRAAWGWCYFPRFLDDDGWPLRVADRIATGEHIYTDIGWVYGPLPVWAVGLLFRMSRAAAWDSLLDALLCLAAVLSVWFISTRLVGRVVGAWISAWAALLGAPIGLISYQLTAYTSAVAWGAATSLLATATALAWVQTASPLTLAATSVFTVGAVLSKPEFGLAGLCVLGTAFWLRRPPRQVLIGAATCLAAVGAFAALGVDSSTLFAWWRGYSGYDLLSTKMVPIVDPDRVAAALALGTCLALCLWSRPAGAVVAAAGALFAATLLARDLTTHGRFPGLLPQLLAFAWAGAIPWLAWIGWRARSRSLTPGFWSTWVYAITVNLRFFLYGEFCAAAAGPAAALFYLAVRERLVPRPTRIGVLALAVVMLASLEAEITTTSRPHGATRIDTPLGSIRVPPRIASEIAVIGPGLEAAPHGALFVSGFGPSWYLLSDRRNPARFDGILEGLGTTPPEVAGLLADLRARPPRIVIVERRFGPTQDYSHDRMWAVLGTGYTSLVSTSRWHLFVADSTSVLGTGVSHKVRCAYLPGAGHALNVPLICSHFMRIALRTWVTSDVTSRMK